MAETNKYDLILNALEQLLEEKKMQHISVSEIAKKAGIGKGSIYYYFPSKEAILDSLIERSYKLPCETAKKLAAQTDVSPLTRIAMLFQACQSVSATFIKEDRSRETSSIQEKAFLHQKYSSHIISELKPVLTSIISQGIDRGEIHFNNPEALAEIVLIVLVIKLDNTLLPSSTAEIENTLMGLITLLEKGADIPVGTLRYLVL